MRGWTCSWPKNAVGDGEVIGMGVSGFREWMERLVRFARVITFDKRGSDVGRGGDAPDTSVEVHR